MVAEPEDFAVVAQAVFFVAVFVLIPLPIFVAARRERARRRAARP